MKKQSILSYLKKLKIGCGLAREDELPFHSRFFLMVYQFWRYLFALIFVGNFILLVIRLGIEIKDPIIVGQSLSYACLYVVIMFTLKQISSDEVQDLFKTIEKMEPNHLDNPNENIKEIYMKYVRITKRRSSQIFKICFIFCVFYTVEHSKVLEGGREYIYFQWFPFNTDDYYWFVIVSQYIYLMTCLIYMMYTKLSVLHISMYILAKLKILQTVIIDSENYANKLRLLNNLTVGEARYAVFSYCVSVHTELIR